MLTIDSYNNIIDTFHNLEHQELENWTHLWLTVKYLWFASIKQEPNLHNNFYLTQLVQNQTEFTTVK